MAVTQDTHLSEGGGLVEGEEQVELQHLRHLSLGVSEDVSLLRLR